MTKYESIVLTVLLWCRDFLVLRVLSERHRCGPSLEIQRYYVASLFSVLCYVTNIRRHPVAANPQRLHQVSQDAVVVLALALVSEYVVFVPHATHT